MERRFKAFVFDLDGTLVDSAAIVERVMKEWCHDHGIDVSELEGVHQHFRAEDSVALVAPHLDAKVEAEQIESSERAIMDTLQEIKGSRGFLEKIPSQLWGIATSSALATAEKKLNTVGIVIPEVLIAAEQVSRGKPDPEAYLSATSQLSVEPTQCLVFEDSETGARSALDAGCHVLLVGPQCQITSERIIGRIKDFREIDLIVDEDFSLGISRG